MDSEARVAALEARLETLSDRLEASERELRTLKRVVAMSSTRWLHWIRLERAAQRQEQDGWPASSTEWYDRRREFWTDVALQSGLVAEGTVRVNDESVVNERVSVGDDFNTNVSLVSPHRRLTSSHIDTTSTMAMRSSKSLRCDRETDGEMKKSYRKLPFQSFAYIRASKLRFPASKTTAPALSITYTGSSGAHDQRNLVQSTQF